MHLPLCDGVFHFWKEVVALVDAYNPAEASTDMVEKFFDDRKGHSSRGEARSKRSSKVVKRPVRHTASFIQGGLAL